MILPLIGATVAVVLLCFGYGALEFDNRDASRYLVASFIALAGAVLGSLALVAVAVALGVIKEARP